MLANPAGDFLNPAPAHTAGEAPSAAELAAVRVVGQAADGASLAESEEAAAAHTVVVSTDATATQPPQQAEADEAQEALADPFRLRLFDEALEKGLYFDEAAALDSDSGGSLDPARTGVFAAGVGSLTETALDPAAVSGTASDEAPQPLRKDTGTDDLLFAALLTQAPATAFDGSAIPRNNAGLAGFSASQNAQPPLPQGDQLAQALGRQQRRFEVNVGQFDPAVTFASRTSGSTLFLMATGAQLHVPAPGGAADESAVTVLDMEVVGANPSAAVSGRGQLSGVTNYFYGGDSLRSYTNVPSFGQVAYQGIYAGIDLVWHGGPAGRQLEYDFVVAPGADPNVIRLGFQGADRLEIDAGGDLVFHAGTEAIRQHRPFTYQEVGDSRVEVPSSFVLTADNQVGFQLGAHDPTRPLVIDPDWEYATYIGGTGEDEATGIALGPTGKTHIVGTTESPQFRPGGPEISTKVFPTGRPVPRLSDVFVTQLKQDNTGYEWVSYLVGNLVDEGTGITVDGAGLIYITGNTISDDFPLQAAWQNAIGRLSKDAFAAKLSADGRTLHYSTYLGGTGEEHANKIAIDGQGRAYIVGDTVSANFNGQNPTVLGNKGAPNDYDAFVMSLASNGGFHYLVYLAGNQGPGWDHATAVAVDGDANAYVTGLTDSTNFYTQAAPGGAVFQNARKGNYDAFVAKIAPPAGGGNPTGVYSTYFGGDQSDSGRDIALDTSGNVWVAGGTATPANQGFGIAPNTVTPSHEFGGAAARGGAEAWVARFDDKGNPDPTQGKFFAYLQGKKDKRAQGIALTGGTGTPNVYVTGWTKSNDKAVADGGDGFPTGGKTLQNPFKAQNPAKVAHAFVALIDPTVAGDGALLYLTYLGGSAEDKGARIAVDGNNNAYVVGRTESNNFVPPPRGGQAYPGAQVTSGGKADGFAVKLKPEPLGNKRPRLGQVLNRTATVGELLTFTATATDDESDPIEFSLNGAPAGASIDSSTGEFTWTPTSAQGPATYTFFVQAIQSGTAPSGAYDEQWITVTVDAAGSGSDRAGDSLSTALTVNLFLGATTELSGTVGDGTYGSLDVDFYRVTLEAGQRIIVDIDAQLTDDGGSLSSLDSYLRLFDANGTQVAANNDGTDPDTDLLGADSVLVYLVPTSGTYYIGVSGYANTSYNPNSPGSGTAGSTGAYLLQITTVYSTGLGSSEER